MRGGLTLVSVTNESPLPIAVAFSRGDLRSVRAPTDMPIEGIDLPAGSVAFPVGHHATLTVGLSHRGGRGALPGDVARRRAGGARVGGHRRAGRAVGAARRRRWRRRSSPRAADLALGGPPDPATIRSASCSRSASWCGWARTPTAGCPTWPPPSFGGRPCRTARRNGWDVAAALDAARRRRGRRRRRRRPAPTSPPCGRGSTSTGRCPDARHPTASVGWRGSERRLVDPAPPGPCRLLPARPAGRVARRRGRGPRRCPAGDGARASFALRWHGERPAILWESPSTSSPRCSPRRGRRAAPSAARPCGRRRRSPPTPGSPSSNAAGESHASARVAGVGVGHQRLERAPRTRTSATDSEHAAPGPVWRQRLRGDRGALGHLLGLLDRGAEAQQPAAEGDRATARTSPTRAPGRRGRR